MIFWIQLTILIIGALAEKVKVDLYYESGCTGCKTLMSGSFKTAFKARGFLDMAEVNFIPFGNTKVRTKRDHYQFTC